MDSVSPQDVYARHLVSRRGYPLWTPEPSMTLPDVYRQQGLKIGDIGVVVPEDGSFDVFFNICLPPTHSLHRRTGVPNNFTPIELEDRDIAIFPEAESAGRIISTSSVARIGRQSSNENISGVAQPGPLNYEFTLSSKEGALLILPEGAERYYLRNQRPFLEEAIQHAVDWYNFAEGRLGRIISHDSLYLITGFYKACSWSLASYEQASGIGGVYAQFKAVQVGSGNISRSYTWETTHALDWRVGPSDQYYNGIANQSVFIQGFKIAVRSSILGAKRVKIKADFPSVRPHRVAFYHGLRWSNVGARLPSTLSSTPAANTPKATDAGPNMDIPEEESSDSGSSILDDVCEDITVQHIPQVPNPFHPSDIINQYLLRSNPSAVIAITHDAQWTTLLERGLIKPEELVQEDHLEELVRNMLPVSREGVVYLQDIASDNDAESNASNDEVVDAQEASPTLPTKKHDTQTEVPETSSGYVDQESPQPDAVAARPRETSNAPVIEVQPHDVHESKSSIASPPVGPAKPLGSILEGSKNASTSSMLKQRLSQTSPDFVRKTRTRKACESCRKSHKNCTYDDNATRCLRCEKRNTPCSLFLSVETTAVARQAPPTLLPIGSSDPWAAPGTPHGSSGSSNFMVTATASDTLKPRVRQVGFETAVTVVIFAQKLKVAVARSHSRSAKPTVCSRAASVSAEAATGDSVAR